MEKAGNLDRQILEVDFKSRVFTLDSINVVYHVRRATHDCSA